MAPNQRSEDKSFVGGYVPRDMKDWLIQTSRRRGMSATALLEECIHRGMAADAQAMSRRSTRTRKQDAPGED